MKFKLQSWQIVIIIFFLIEAFINPTGEFPLNDDWAYSKSIEIYCRTGLIELSNWIAIPFLSQFFLGIVFSKIFGFSFFGLRLLSILASLFSIYILHLILELLEINKNKSLFVLAVFIFNPLTLSLCNTFLPDSIILFFALISFYFMIKIIKKSGNFNILFFLIFTVLGTINRQTGILIPLIFGVVFYILTSKNWKNLFISIFPFLINILVLLLSEIVLNSNEILPDNYNLQLSRIIETIVHPSIDSIRLIGVNFVSSTLCLGLMILPFTISNFKFHYKEISQSKYVNWIFYGFLLVVLLKVFFTGFINPFIGNIFYPFGTGPIILTGFNTDKIQIHSFLTKSFFIVLNVLGCLSFSFAIHSILKSIITTFKKDINWVSIFFILLFICYLFPICFNYANDRYLLFLIPFFFVGYIKSYDFEFNKILFIISFLPIFYFSVASSFDYFRLNQARWKALNHLTNELLILPQQIDGGFEFNAWYLSESINYDPSHEGRWWWIVKDDYIISPKKRKGYFIESRYPFTSILSYPFNELYVLKKINK